MPPRRANRRAARAVACLLLVWPCSTSLAQTDDPQSFGFDHEGVLGASLQFEVRALNEQVAARVDRNVLDEIERLRKVLRAHDADSQLRQLARTSQPVPASPYLRAVLAACEHWMEASGGAVHPGVQLLGELWKQAAERGRPPSDAELESACAKLPRHMWRIDEASGTVLALSSVPATLDALAKGYILDRACEVAVSPLVVVIGGDLRAKNGASTVVAVADPRVSADDSAPLCRLLVKDATVERQSGRYSLVEARVGSITVLDDLHKGRDSGDGWSLVIDVAAIVTSLSALTGLWLLLQVRRRRRIGMVVALIGTAVLALVLAAWVP